MADSHWMERSVWFYPIFSYFPQICPNFSHFTGFGLLFINLLPWYFVWPDGDDANGLTTYWGSGGLPCHWITHGNTLIFTYTLIVMMMMTMAIMMVMMIKMKIVMRKSGHENETQSLCRWKYSFTLPWDVPLSSYHDKHILPPNVILAHFLQGGAKNFNQATFCKLINTELAFKALPSLLLE